MTAKVSKVSKKPNLLLGLSVVAAVLLLLVTIRQFSQDNFGLDQQISDLFTFALSIIFEATPYVFLGIFVSIFVQVILPDEFLIRILPQNPWLRRMVISLLGFLFPVCECGNVPMTRGLIRKGFNPAESITFLVAAPILNPVTILTTQQVFGWDSEILIGRLVFGFLMANFVGWVFSLHPKPELLLTPKFAASCLIADRHDHKHGPKAKLAEAVNIFAAETTTMLPALILGSFIAGAIQVFVPRDVLLFVGSNPVLSVLSLMLLAFVISICSSVDAFFALSFSSIFMPGALVAFLVLGPVVDIKMLVMIKTTFTAKTVATLVTLVVMVSAIAGLVVNYFA